MNLLIYIAMESIRSTVVNDTTINAVYGFLRRNSSLQKLSYGRRCHSDHMNIRSRCHRLLPSDYSFLNEYCFRRRNSSFSVSIASEWGQSFLGQVFAHQDLLSRSASVCWVLYIYTIRWMYHQLPEASVFSSLELDYS